MHGRTPELRLGPGTIPATPVSLPIARMGKMKAPTGGMPCGGSFFKWYGIKYGITTEFDETWMPYRLHSCERCANRQEALRQCGVPSSSDRIIEDHCGVGSYIKGNLDHLLEDSGFYFQCFDRKFLQLTIFEYPA